MNIIITYENLREATGINQGAALIRYLDSENIRFFGRKQGKPWTTIDLINAAGGLKTRSAESEVEEIEV